MKRIIIVAEMGTSARGTAANGELLFTLFSVVGILQSIRRKGLRVVSKNGLLAKNVRVESPAQKGKTCKGRETCKWILYSA